MPFTAAEQTLANMSKVYPQSAGQAQGQCGFCARVRMSRLATDEGRFPIRGCKNVNSED